MTSSCNYTKHVLCGCNVCTKAFTCTRLIHIYRGPWHQRQMHYKSANEHEGKSRNVRPTLDSFCWYLLPKSPINAVEPPLENLAHTTQHIDKYWRYSVGFLLHRGSSHPPFPWMVWMWIGGLGYQEIPMSNAMLVNKDFQTCRQIGWQQSRQPIRSHVRKPLLINMKFNMAFT